MGLVDYLVLGGYLVVMIVIGLIAMRRVHAQEDYFMGGRSFGKLLQTFAAFGAGTGAHEPVTVGRTVWTSGLSGVWSALMWLFVTPIYWITAVWYRRMRHLTLGDWFVERYESRAMGAAYTVFAIVFYMFYLSTMFSAIAMFAVPLLEIDSIGTLPLKYVLIPILAATVIAYGVLGGLRAAYWTDLIQGLFIILLSVLLIPFGLWALVTRFGNPSAQSMWDGLNIMHQRVPADYFQLFAGPAAGEFPIQYIISLTLLALVGIVVQPHFIATGGGSARSEDAARIGLVAGNFLKRLCTVGWAITALIALALLAGNNAIAANPDQVWGIAAREILGPLNIGLVGLMLACLMAAMMSSADTYMLVTSALVVRNVYAAYVDPSASEQRYVALGRLTGLILIVGAAVVAMLWVDVFGQFKMAVEIPIVFAAPFWIGMYWRRANTTAVWITMALSLLVFFILPYLLPAVSPSLRTDPRFTVTTPVVQTTTTRPATTVDVARHQAWTAAHQDALRITESDRRKEALDRLGSEPPTAQVGQPISVTTRLGGQAIYWSDGVSAAEGTNPRRGRGAFQADFLMYSSLGVDLSRATKATLETLRLPPRLAAPFLVLILLSWITPKNRRHALDRYYVKMKTEVHPDPAEDRQQLAESYKNPNRFDDRKLFPRSQLEFVRPRVKDVAGVAVSVAICGLIVALLIWIAGLGQA